MDFKFSEDQQLIQQTIEEFVADNIEESADTVLDGLSEMGFMGIFVPEQYQGAESDFTSYILALEELAKHSGSTALRYAIQNTQIIYPLLKYGSEELKEKYIPKLASGELKGAYAYSEAAEELYAISAQAVKDGEAYKISGKKTFVLNGDKADLFIVYANVEDKLAAFVVDAKSNGLTVGEAYTKMGLDEVAAVDVTLDNVNAELLSLDGTVVVKDVSLTHGIALSSIANGLSTKGYLKCIDYGQSRVQFKKPIITFDAPREMVGQMIVNVEGTKLLVYKAAVAKDNGESYEDVAMIARAASMRLGEQNLRNSIQVHGGYGYTRDLGVEVMFRDMKGLQVLENFERPLVLAVADYVIG